jgi:hypothetical protein
MTAPVWKQDVQSTPVNAATTNVTITPTAAGNLLMIAFGADTAGSGGTTISSVTATNGNTPVQIFPLTYNGADNNCVGGLYYIPSVAAGATTITVTLSSSVLDFSIIVDEYSGASSVLDGSAQGTGNNTGSTAASTNNFTTSNPADVIYSVCCFSTQNVASAGSGFNLRSNLSTSVFTATEDKTVASAGSYAGTWTLGNTSVDYVLFAAGLQPPAPSTIGAIPFVSAEW